MEVHTQKLYNTLHNTFPKTSFFNLQIHAYAKMYTMDVKVCVGLQREYRESDESFERKKKTKGALSRNNKQSTTLGELRDTLNKYH